MPPTVAGARPAASPTAASDKKIQPLEELCPICYFNPITQADSGNKCNKCNQIVCADCMLKCDFCGLLLHPCEREESVCYLCDEFVCCPDCKPEAMTWCDVCEESHCPGCFEGGHTCSQCARSICDECSNGEEAELEDEMRGCKDCKVFTCARCCGEYVPASSFPTSFRTCLPHLAPVVELEERVIAARGLSFDPTRFGHGEKAAELCRIDDREAVEKLSRRALGTHATVGVDGSKTIEVYVPNVVRACMLALRARDRPWRLPQPPHAGPPVHA